MSDKPILASIDKVRKKKLSVKLVAADGSEVSFEDTIKKLCSYVHDKLSAETNNSLATQVLPLMTQTLGQGLTEIMGRDMTEMLLSFEGFRAPCLSMMILSFTLLKFLQQKEIKMITVEEDLTDEEIDQFHRRSELIEAVEIARTAGIQPREFLRALYKSGRYTKEEINQITKGGIDLDDLEDVPADREIEDEGENDPPDEE